MSQSMGPSGVPSCYSRRQFIQIAGASVGALAGGSGLAAVTHDADRFLEHGSPLHEFHYGQVEFAPGPHETQLEQTHSVLVNLDEDALLWGFRHHAGLPAPGCSLGGMYSLEVQDAETFGQWVSALARYHAITGDEATRAKVERLVHEFALTIEPSGRMYGPAPNSYKYSMIVRALLDAHELTHMPTALDVLSRTTNSIAPRLPGKPTNTDVDGWTMMMPENQFLAWQHTGRSIHLELARENLYNEFFDVLARGDNALPGRNAFGHMEALNSAAKAYLVTGEERYLLAAKNGFAFVEAQSFATGAWGPNECFLPSSKAFGDTQAGVPEGWMPPIRTLGDSLVSTHWHFETGCGSSAHFKLTRYLLRITKDATYGDSMERLMYNTVLGAKELQQNGRAFYHCDYNSDGRKGYYNGYGFSFAPEWPCCSASLPLVVTDYRINTYFGDDNGVYVNLYIPSTLSWQQNGAQASLRQTGSYPLSDRVSFSLTLSQPRAFTLRLRIPTWAKEPRVSVNGKTFTTVLKPGAFASLRRDWLSGDQIELELPHDLELRAVDSEHPDTMALVFGPLVLFAVCTETPQLTRSELLSAHRVSPESAEWRVVSSAGKSVRFAPFWSIDYERYSTYLTVRS